MSEREFFSFAEDISSEELKNKEKLSKKDGKLRILVDLIQQSILGRAQSFVSPYGRRSILYCDYTASGKPLSLIENYIAKNVLPWYSNTHTISDVCGLQTTSFRQEARQIVGEAVNARADDVVIFTGSGSTAAVNQLVRILELNNMLPIDGVNKKKRTVVVCGPFEHHSNYLPWKEAAGVDEVIQISATPDGSSLDFSHLKNVLQQLSHEDCDIIGTFSAASNITGVVTDVDAVSALIHSHGGLAFFDFAAAAPYMKIDMNPVSVDGENISKDAVFISPHKFLGGPGTPGILVVKKKLLRNLVPSSVGGGTVFFVTEKDQHYLNNKIEREEAGTPDIIGSIRAGLVFKLHTFDVGLRYIVEREEEICRKVFTAWKNIPNLYILGPPHPFSSSSNASNSNDSTPFVFGSDAQSTRPSRLPIFSFLIRHPKSGRLLHYNFVCCLLNDLFGIQSRGGCACAGPYALSLLGINYKNAKQIELELMHKVEVLRPGFTRLNFSYVMTDVEVDYVIAAVELIAKNGYLLLSDYRFHDRKGDFRQKTQMKFTQRQWLSNWHPVDDYLKSQSNRNNNTNSNHSNVVVDDDKDANINNNNNNNIDDENEKIEEELESEVKNDEKVRLKHWDKYLHAAKIIFDEAAIKLGLIQDGSSNIGSSKNNDKLQLLNSEIWIGSGGESSVSSLRWFELPFDVGKIDSESLVIHPNSNIHGDNNEIIASGGDVQVEKQKSTLQQTKLAGIGKEKLTNDKEKEKEKEKEKTKQKQLFPEVPKKLYSLVGTAIRDWGMIEQGDRVLIGLSGGKDSLTLLHILHGLQRKSPVKFEIAAATVAPGIASFDPSPLIGYLQRLGIPYFYLNDHIFEQAKECMEGDSICSFCSRMKRGALYTCMEKKNYNVLALGQHLDDIAESFLMSTFRNGSVRTMKANYVVGKDEEEGDGKLVRHTEDGKVMRVVRPLAYCREEELKAYAYGNNLPVIADNCPACFIAPQERHRVKKLLAKEEAMTPALFGSLRKALTPLMSTNVVAAINQVNKDIQQNFTDSQQKRIAKPKANDNNNNNNSSSSSSSNNNDQPQWKTLLLHAILITTVAIASRF